MGGGEAGRDLGADRGGPGDGQLGLLLDEVAQRLAVQELHGQVRQAAACSSMPPATRRVRLGWRSLRVMRTSREKRCTALVSPPVSICEPVRRRRIVLTATARSGVPSGACRSSAR
ncbi:hypothetical protein [Streptomyces sp. NPDC058632]|uniref:hypothetical protein n=1 Tax=Streptomyces sp. NPDC058632 TaxID=3346567 RepID=UPI0036636F94